MTSKLTRRRFLMTTGGAVVGATVSSGLTSAEHLESKPSHISLTYDQDEMERFRPLLEIGHLNIQPTAMYGWIASSNEFSETCYVYFNHFTNQEGLTRFDSHFLDREPCYVFVNESGNVTEVVYSAYHWLAAKATGPGIPLHDSSHPAFRVAEKWHHYLLDPEKTGSFIQVRKLGDDAGLRDDDVKTQYEVWLDNGWEEDLEPDVVQNPWRMRTRSYWWKDNPAGFSLSAIRRQGTVRLASLTGLDIRGAGNTDLN